MNKFTPYINMEYIINYIESHKKELNEILDLSVKNNKEVAGALTYSESIYIYKIQMSKNLILGEEHKVGGIEMESGIKYIPFHTHANPNVPPGGNDIILAIGNIIENKTEYSFVISPQKIFLVQPKSTIIYSIMHALKETSKLDAWKNNISNNINKIAYEYFNNEISDDEYEAKMLKNDIIVKIIVI